MAKSSWVWLNLSERILCTPRRQHVVSGRTFNVGGFYGPERTIWDGLCGRSFNGGEGAMIAGRSRVYVEKLCKKCARKLLSRHRRYVRWDM